MATRFGIIGFPISHSISPVFQQAALDYFNLDASYQTWTVQPDQLSEFIQEVRNTDVVGINVTVPHKESVLSYLDEVDEWATVAGAVNTIVNRKGKLIGYNTDGIGFLRALREVGKFAPNDCRVLILGAGGAARAVVLALIREGVGQLTIANRTEARALQLSQMAIYHGLTAQVIPMDPLALASAAASAELIVNCTTIGMAHGPDEQLPLLPWDQIPAAALVNDLVYNPMETPLLKEASRAGARTLGGIHMLVFQGAASFEMWTGLEVPIPIMLETATRAMEVRSKVC